MKWTNWFYNGIQILQTRTEGDGMDASRGLQVLFPALLGSVYINGPSFYFRENTQTVLTPDIPLRVLPPIQILWNLKWCAFPDKGRENNSVRTNCHHSITTGLSSFERLTWRGFCSRLNTIFRKGALLMTRFGFVSAMMVSANTVKHVRMTVVYNHPKIREA